MSNGLFLVIGSLILLVFLIEFMSGLDTCKTYGSVQVLYYQQVNNVMVPIYYQPCLEE